MNTKIFLCKLIKKSEFALENAKLRTGVTEEEIKNLQNKIDCLKDAFHAVMYREGQVK